jgi:site-specific DNA recombinase
MKSALYARFSTDRQREESIDDQLRACERVARANGLEIARRFSDAGVSGGTGLRSGYRDLLAEARAGAFHIIVAEDISRLWRNRADYGTASAELEDLDVHLLTCVGDDTRRDGWGLVLGIKHAIGEAARRETSYRTRRGMEGLALAGRSTGGRCYGYGAPEEAAVLREIFTLAAHGARPAAIAETLNQRRVPAPRGLWWSLNTIKRILGNPRYAGRLIWGATVSQGGARDSRLKRHVMRPDGPLVARQIEPLVEPTLWAACNPRASVG